MKSSAPSKNVKLISMLDRCVDAAVKKTFRVTSSDNCVFIRSYLGLSHIEEIVRKRTVSFMNNFMNNLVTQQLSNDVVHIGFSELFDFND